MKKIALLLCFTFFGVYAQHITVLDSLSQKPIPLVHIYDGSKGVIANNAGVFYWQDSRAVDSLSFSCLGYAAKKIARTQLKDSIFLMPRVVALLEVVVSNRILSAEEIIDKVIATTENNIDFGFSLSEVFLHEVELSNIEKMDFEINKSTIPELGQRFIDEILEKVPKKEIDESFSKSKWLRDNGGLKFHKLHVLQAARLTDSVTNELYNSMSKTIDEILKKRVKKDSYFKVKSGPFLTFKVKNPVKEVDTVAQKKWVLTPKKFAENTLGVLQRVAYKDLFENKGWILPFIDKRHKYQFTYEGIVYHLRVPVYKIRFSTGKKKDYNGYLLVDVEDFGVHKIVYQSNNHESRLKLLGLFYEERLNNKSYTFVKNHLGKYTLYHIYEDQQQQMGIKRPLTIIEKNKIVKGRNRQNTLAMDIHLGVKEVYQKSIYFNAITPISKNEFDAYVLKHSVLPKDLYSKAAVKKYMPGLPIE